MKRREFALFFGYSKNGNKWKSSLNEFFRKKFEKTLEKIWKGRTKRFIFAPTFVTRQSRAIKDRNKFFGNIERFETKTASASPWND